MINNYWARWACLVIFPVITSGCAKALAAPAEGYQGIVEFDEWVLGFELPGRITSLEAVRGGVLDAKARVAALDSAVEATLRDARRGDLEAASAQVALLKAGSRAEDVQAMDAQVRAARANEDLLGRNLTREKALLARSASTEAAVDELSGRLDAAKAERQSLEQRLASLRRGSRAEEKQVAEARVTAAQAAVKLEDERLSRHELFAPAKCVVLDLHVKQGEFVGAGTPIVTLGDTSHPYADVFVPEGSLAGVKPGVKVDLRVDGEPTVFSGSIESVGRKTEFTPRFLFSERERPNLVVRVRVRVDDPGEKLHAGVPAFVNFHLGEAR
jgi:HlyD family secretion protein